MWYARLRTTAVGAAVASAVAKAALITANDDWDAVAYSARKLPSRAYAAVVAPVLSAAGVAVPPAAPKPRVVVLGSGWGALTFIRSLDQSAVDLTVVSPRSFFFYTPLLAGTASGTVAPRSILEPIRWFLERAGHGGAAFIAAECTAIDPAARTVTCAVAGGGGEALALPYDHLVIAVGAEPVTFGIPGVREHARFLKELEDGGAIQRDVLTLLERASALAGGAEAAAAAGRPDDAARLDAEVSRLLSWVVVGGGPTGVELTAELLDFVRCDVARYWPGLAPRVSVTLLEAAERILGVFDPRLAATAAATLTRLGARVQCGAAVTRVTPLAVEFRRTGGAKEPGAVPAGTVVWAGGVARRPVVEAFAKRLDPSGAAQTSRHGLVVDAWLRVKGAPLGSVFALGDCAVSGAPPTAQAATQQGRFLGRAFRDALPALARVDGDPGEGGGAGGAAPRVQPFAYASRGALAYTGDGTGVAELRASLWDARPGEGGEATRVEGAPAYAIWRSLYFSSILSTSNQLAVLGDWARSAVFGRSISTPSSGEARALTPPPAAAPPRVAPPAAVSA